MWTSPNVRKRFTNSPSPLTFCLLQNIACVVWTIYSWQGFNSLGCPLIIRTNCRCFQSLNISVDVAKYVENVHILIHHSHIWTVTKNDLSSLNNLFMARFQLNSMCTYVMNKLQMCSVTEHLCRRREKCENFSQISPLHSLFLCCKKMTCLDWTIYSWQG